MALESCGICGGDGRIGNSFGLTTTCPSCHGTGRRGENGEVFRDVTKTKPSHHATKAAAAVKQTAPTTFEGLRLAGEIQSSSLAEATKVRLVREIMEYEGSHGRCTQTFIKKIRKQLK